MKIRHLGIILVLSSLCVSAVFAEDKAVQFSLSSPTFINNGLMPARYTCDGDNISPALNWNSVPPRTKSFALLVKDPDAPSGNWVHWVIFNIPPSERSLPEASDAPLKGEVMGVNDFGNMGYGGPCPPSGTHRYIFRLYALDTVLDLGQAAKAQSVEAALNGHVLDKAELIGLYSRSHS